MEAGAIKVHTRPQSAHLPSIRSDGGPLVSARAILAPFASAFTLSILRVLGHQAVEVQVSGAFHTPLMQPAREALEKVRPGWLPRTPTQRILSPHAQRYA